MPKVVWTSENDRKLLIRLIERSAKSYDTVELCKIFPGATPKAIEERIAKLKREAKAMDHPKPRNHPKGKSGPKKRVATVALLAPAEAADTKKVKVTTDPAAGSVTDSVTDPKDDTLSVLGAPDAPETPCPKTEAGEPSLLESPHVKCEPILEIKLEHGSEIDLGANPKVGPSVDPRMEPSIEPSIDPEINFGLGSDPESDSESEVKSKNEDAGDQEPCPIKAEKGTLEQF